MQSVLDLGQLWIEGGKDVLEMEVADDDGGAGDAEGDSVGGEAGLVGIDCGVDTLGLEEGDERCDDLIGERAGERKVAVVGGDLGFEDAFEFGGLPPNEVGEVDWLELAAG